MPIDRRLPVPLDARNPPSPKAKRAKLLAGDHSHSDTLQKYLAWLNDAADPNPPQMLGHELQRALGEISVAAFAPEARPAARLVI